MEINLTPFIKIAGMGGAGYLWGQVLNSNPRLTATIWALSELAVQIIRSQARYLSHNEENLVLIVGACVTTGGMAYYQLIKDLAMGCICALTVALSSALLNGFFNSATYALHLRIRPLRDQVMIRL